MHYELNKFWRVGYHTDPLAVSLRYQKGDGRFDDPRHELTVLYGGDSAVTCIFEVALPWVPHPDAGYAHHTEPPDPDFNEEERLLAQEQAARDVQLASQAARLPQTLYTNAKVHVEIDPIGLCDLDHMSIRNRLATVPAITALMRDLHVPQIDRGVLTGQDKYLVLTRAIAGFLMRSPLFGIDFPGLSTLSRHQGMSYVLFQGRYAIRRHIVAPTVLTPSDPHVLQAAGLLGLQP